MSIVTPRTVSGVLELLPHDQVVLQSMFDTIRQGFESFGFLPISTPAMEPIEVLLTRSGGETERQVYLAQSTGARAQGYEPDAALRFDLTVPLARYVAGHEGELTFPFRRYQMQPVWRGETPQRGRFREFIQCDIDVIDRDELSIRYDAEMPAVIAAIFTKLGIGDFTIRLNNRRLLRGLLAYVDVTDPDQQGLALRELDKLERIGAGAVGEALVTRGLTAAAAAGLLEMAGQGLLRGGAARKALSDLPGGNDLLIKGKEELAEVLSLVETQGVSPDRVALDLSIARGLDYYTGTVYETTLDGYPEVGSICSGGRYDNLASLYTKSRLPGVGISIGLTRLFWQLRELGMASATTSPVEVFVTLIDEEGFEPALRLAAELRMAGINTEVSMKSGKLARQLKYADRARIPIVVIAGEDERGRGTVQVRNLVTQTQREVAASELTATVSSLL